MRIVHVVTLMSKDGAFGGPLRVALNQAKELQARGNDVVLASTTLETPDEFTAQIEGVPVLLFKAFKLPGLGFSGLLSVGLWAWLLRNGKRFEIAHVHSGRDLITQIALICCALLRLPSIVQTHGMISPDRRWKTLLFDLLLTRWFVVRRPQRQLCLTRLEEDALIGMGCRSTVVLPNGVESEFRGLDRRAIEPGQSVEVLFMGRLQKRKNPLLFVQIADRLRNAAPHLKWRLVGPNEGEANAVLDLIATLSLEEAVAYEGAVGYDNAKARLAKADIFVLPSINEPFPMVVLEALSVGVPVVCTSSCGLSPYLVESGAGIVVEPTVEQMAEAVLVLANDLSRRLELIENGRELVEGRLSLSEVVAKLSRIYAESLVVHKESLVERR